MNKLHTIWASTSTPTTHRFAALCVGAIIGALAGMVVYSAVMTAILH